MNNLHLSDEAQADLAGIKSYIAKNLENPSAAISTVRNITKDIRRLREHSLIGASLSSIADVESDYRFLVTGSYLTFYRMQVAMSLLKDCRVKVYEVADQVGYSDTAYFSVQFKKLLGVSPSEYQERCGR